MEEDREMRIWKHIAAGCAVALFCSQGAYAASSEMDILLKKLQEKGILSSEEAAAVAKETKQAAEAQKSEVKETAAKAAAETVSKSGAALPDWVRNTKFKGDLRLRYEARDREDDARGEQGRGRFRLRAGAETTITDGLSVGFGLASGTGDQRSANQTLGNIFTRKSIWVDTAYARYAPTSWFSIIGGKFTNPIWQPADMLISNDVNPEGAAVRLEGNVSSKVGLFLNAGGFVLSDRNGASPATSDPLMYVFQPGVKFNFTKDMFFRFAPAWYVVSDLKGTAAFSSTDASTASLSNTNTQTTAGKYAYNYSVINWGGEFGMNNPFGISAIPYLGILGGYIHNPSPSRNNDGYLAGLSVGYPDVKKFGDWAVEYTFRRMEKDAWLDFLPDSSFYSGNTNVMGHRIKVLFGLTKNVALGLNCYNTWLVRKYNPTSSLVIPASTRDQSSTENLVQADVIFKF
jgi:hypothetical protein